MALDWEPLATPKRGYEREFVELFHALVQATGARRERVMRWFTNISDPPFTTLGAPRIGHDPAADDWLRARLEKTGRGAELPRLVIEMRGDHVLELLPPSDGFPVYSDHLASDYLDRYSFHAELLADHRDTLGEELWQRGHQMMLPDDHKAFAEQLFDVAIRFADEHTLPSEVETIREPVFPEGTVERSGHILFAAAKWCWYWSERGYGLAVSY
ncbi:MAG: hypothetical protein ACREBE_12730 [bacterium]